MEVRTSSIYTTKHTNILVYKLTQNRNKNMMIWQKTQEIYIKIVQIKQPNGGVYFNHPKPKSKYSCLFHGTYTLHCRLPMILISSCKLIPYQSFTKFHGLHRRCPRNIEFRTHNL